MYLDFFFLLDNHEERNSSFSLTEKQTSHSILDFPHYFFQKGYYCESSNLTSPSGKCLPGYFCYKGSSDATPDYNSESGGPCPAGIQIKPIKLKFTLSPVFISSHLTHDFSSISYENDCN